MKKDVKSTGDYTRFEVTNPFNKKETVGPYTGSFNEEGDSAYTYLADRSRQFKNNMWYIGEGKGYIEGLNGDAVAKVNNKCGSGMKLNGRKPGCVLAMEHIFKENPKFETYVKQPVGYLSDMEHMFEPRNKEHPVEDNKKWFRAHEDLVKRGLEPRSAFKTSHVNEILSQGNNASKFAEIQNVLRINGIPMVTKHPKPSVGKIGYIDDRQILYGINKKD